ncbi:hypothetical protein BH11PAT1_BH11PAT1_2710 [soil metagenome]
MKRSAYLIGILVLVIIGLAVVQVTVSNQISTHGVYLSKLQEELKSYKKENTLLEEKILEKSSLTTIEEKAKSLGLSPAKSAMYLNTPLPLAVRTQNKITYTN